jgi:alpha-beta hydrolase superfamily lysophospholipase
MPLNGNNNLKMLNRNLFSRLIQFVKWLHAVTPNYLKALVPVIILSAFIIVFIPYVKVTELLYPVRIDSMYVKAQQQEYLMQAEPGQKFFPQFYYTPAQLGMPFTDISIRAADNIFLKGWYIPAKEPENFPTLLLLHDINDSKISLLEHARQFRDRGFAVCLMDLRAHGASEGGQSTLGYLEVLDAKKTLDYLYKQPQTGEVAVMGTGLGAVVAAQLASLDNRPRVLVVQSPFNTLIHFVQDYSKEKFGFLSEWAFPRIRRQMEKRMGYNIEIINLIKTVQKLKSPVMFVAGSKDITIRPEYTRMLYDTCASDKKEYWPVTGADHFTIEETAGDEYFNRVSVFIFNNIPKKSGKSKYKRLV